MEDIQVANKGIKKAKASEVVIQFRNIGDIREAHIVCFCDASFRNLKGESSQGAHVIFLNPIRSGGGALKAPPLRFFALTHLILELHYCALVTFPKK